MDEGELAISPAQVYAALVGLLLVLAGLIGFFYSSDFGDPGTVDGVFGVLDVNGWHNVIHLISGLLGLAAFAFGAAASRAYALAFGVVYLAVAVWGLAVGDGGAILSVVPVNTEDNVLHIIIGLAGLAAWAASRPRDDVIQEERA